MTPNAGDNPLLVFPVPLGTTAQATALFSYPNIPGGTASLTDTILHWINQTLSRDGLTQGGASATVNISGDTCTLSLQGPALVSNALLRLAKSLRQFIANGASAQADIAAIQAQNPSIWDPQKNGWRYMLPWGLPLINQRSVLLFHFPPMNLLNPSQDYLDDAVPTRWTELLAANGATDPDNAVLMQRYLDCAPIAAGDDQGTYISQVLTPTDYFRNYQLAQLALFLLPQNSGFTIPLVVCGSPPRQVFGSLFNVTLGVNQAMLVEIVPGFKTPVLGANHPYYFYAQAQGFNTVGSGTMLPSGCPTAQGIMVQDLIAARWQLAMAADPTQDPGSVLTTCTSYWHGPGQAAAVCAMVQHEGTLFYPTGTPAVFTFKTSLAQGAAFCAAHADNPCASP